MKGLRAIGAAFADMPRRFRAPFVDRLRRRNLLARIAEGYCGGLAALAGFALAMGLSLAMWSWWELCVLIFSQPYVYIGALAAPFVEFVVYEFLLEPLGFSGHYWERGPRDGEEFTEN